MKEEKEEEILKDKKKNIEEETALFARVEEFLQVFRKNAEFTQDVLKENEKLRFKVVQLEGEVSRLKDILNSHDPNAELRKKINELEQGISQMLDKFRQVEDENRTFAQRYIEIEEENNNLANLYIASYQLHSTLDFKDVLQIIMEIIINLIGAEEFGILLLDEKAKDLRAVSAEGIERDIFPAFKLGSGIIGNVAQSGESYFKDKIPDIIKLDFHNPLVCIPLKIKDKIIGVIVVYKLLQQKKAFTSLDNELFTLLAGHAATAIFSSKLYSESERKLTTIQSFIDLLAK